jgi:hypothetical protein
MKTQLAYLGTAVVLLAFAFAPNAANAQVLALEDFSYPDGASLSSQTGWASHSGTAGNLLVTGGKAVVDHSSNEDVNFAFTDVTSGVLTATFDIVVNATEDITGMGEFPDDYEYFAHFFEEGTFNFRARLSVVPSPGTGNYTLGISSTTGTEEATLSSGLNFGDTVPVVLALDVTTGIASLTVNGETISGTTGNLGETMNLFALRQSFSTHNETIAVDNLVISTGTVSSTLLGDVNLDETVDFLDITPFIGVLSNSGDQAEADCNEDGSVDFLDITPFIAILSGSNS